MVVVDEVGSSGGGNGGVNNGGSEKGCFVMWQMVPDKWQIELVLSGQKVAAGSNGSVAWRHTPWLGTHAAKDQKDLAQRSDNTAEMIKHSIFGYFSQRSGLLVHLEDSYLTRIQAPGFGDNIKAGTDMTRLEESWTIDDVAFNVPGLSMDCFIPPQELQKDYPEEGLDWRSPLHR
ncbi:hypothetical protein AHAS_Ahas02G0252300 [Arachis hypogaea]